MIKKIVNLFFKKKRAAAGIFQRAPLWGSVQPHKRQFSPYSVVFVTAGSIGIQIFGTVWETILCWGRKFKADTGIYSCFRLAIRVLIASMASQLNACFSLERQKNKKKICVHYITFIYNIWVAINSIFTAPKWFITCYKYKQIWRHVYINSSL